MNTFISYSHKDRGAFEQLNVHLTNLIRNGIINSWSDVEISPGQVIDEKIKENLNSAELYLLLVSPDFLASSYCIEVELEHAIKRHKLGDAVIIPIIIRFCDWKNTEFLKEIKVLPTDGEPINSSPDLDASYLDVVDGIRQSIKLWNVSKQTVKSASLQDELKKSSSINKRREEENSQIQELADNSKVSEFSKVPDTPREKFLKAVELAFEKSPVDLNQETK